MYEIIILLFFIVLFTAVFMLTLSALFYSLANLASGEVIKLNNGRSGSNAIISFGKVFAASFIGFSLFVYAMSFFLRIGNDALMQQKSGQITENRTSPEKTLLLSQKENSDAPLFDFIIQSAARQNEKKQKTSVAVFSVIFGLSVVLTTALYLIYRTRK